MVMIVVVVVISCLVSSSMVSHSGRKSVSGGSPARKSKTNIKVIVSMFMGLGFFVHEIIIINTFRTLVVLRARHIVAVIRQYK